MPYFEVLAQQTAPARAELFAIPVIARLPSRAGSRARSTSPSSPRPITTSSTRCRC